MPGWLHRREAGGPGPRGICPFFHPSTHPFIRSPLHPLLRDRLPAVSPRRPVRRRGMAEPDRRQRPLRERDPVPPAGCPGRRVDRHPGGPRGLPRRQALGGARARRLLGPASGGTGQVLDRRVARRRLPRRQDRDVQPRRQHGGAHRALRPRHRVGTEQEPADRDELPGREPRRGLEGRHALRETEGRQPLPNVRRNRVGGDRRKRPPRRPPHEGPRSGGSPPRGPASGAGASPRSSAARGRVTSSRRPRSSSRSGRTPRATCGWPRAKAACGASTASDG